jgi:hypothetical protein
LKDSGIALSKLRLVYVKARLDDPDGPRLQAHMVLAYYATPNAEPLVLDNLVPEILPASQRKDLQPVFSFNSEAVWNGVAGNSAKGKGGTGQLSRWQDLLAPGPQGRIRLTMYRQESKEGIAMSMYRQLWLAIIVSMLLALVGSMLATLLSARAYLEQQLEMKNADNAVGAGAVAEPAEHRTSSPGTWRWPPCSTAAITNRSASTTPTAS